MTHMCYTNPLAYHTYVSSETNALAYDTYVLYASGFVSDVETYELVMSHMARGRVTRLSESCHGTQASSWNSLTMVTCGNV